MSSLRKTGDEESLPIVRKRKQNGADDRQGGPAMGPSRVKVLVPLAVPTAFDYRLDQETPLGPGSLVRVPVGQKTYIGAVWQKTDSHDQSDYDFDRLKPVQEVLATQPLPQDLIQFIDWVAGYTMSPAGAVLRMSMPPAIVGKEAPARTLYLRHANAEEPEGLSVARKRVWEAAVDQPKSVSALAMAAGVSQSVVRAMIQANHLRGIEVKTDRPVRQPDLALPGPKLSTEQADAAKALAQSVKRETFETFMLHGVTGSGKTEVYFEGLHAALARFGAQILVLVPEIALTTQWLERFEQRFGVPPIVWHSDITPAARRRAWNAVASGEAKVVVGARSALFLPFKSLGFITVDEEHDPSYKQEEGVLYHARDMAVLRAKLADCPIVLASATPSLETQHNAATGKYKSLILKERHGGAVLPTMNAVDMRVNPPPAGQWLSPVLTGAIKQALSDGEQSLLFLNRRGYAPLTLCRTCGHRFECDSCSTWLVEHRFRQQMQCHQCGFITGLPSACPECKSTDSLAACGPGVERVFEEVSSQFPEAKTVVMTSDTMTSSARMQGLIQQIESGHVDIIIGTQLITKGYHFPRLTCVGVVDADLGLRGGDLRASERTYQQLVQVSGRAGRAERPGTVYLQSYEPEHPVLQAMMTGDSDAFMQAELAARQSYNMPPYGQLVAIILSGTDVRTVMQYGSALAANAPDHLDVRVMGPAPAPLARIRGRYRARLLVHIQRRLAVQKIMAEWTGRVKPDKSVRLRIDIDPYSFL